MTRWQQLEQWIETTDPTQFTSNELASSAGCSRQQASSLISAYLTAQRGSRAQTMFVLKREGRTSNAVWSVGERTADARVVGGEFVEDMRMKFQRALEPDLTRIAELNPRAMPYVESTLTSIVDGALVVMAAAVGHALNGQS